MRSIWSAVVVAAGCAWGSAAAQETVAVGVLTCNVSAPVETGSGGTAGVGPKRDVLCALKLRNGVEETYLGQAQVVSVLAAEKSTFLWSVKAPFTGMAAPGVLQQSFAADPRTPPGQIPDLIGEQNSAIVLHSMTERKEGSVSANETPRAARRAVIGIELKLKSSMG